MRSIPTATIRKGVVALSLALAAGAAGAGATGCSDAASESDGEPTASSESEFAIAIPLYFAAITVEQAVVLWAIGGVITIGGVNLYTSSSRRRSDFSTAQAAAIDNAARTENRLIESSYAAGLGQKLNVGAAVTPNAVLGAFHYSPNVTANIGNASRELVKSARTTHRDGGCVIAEVTHAETQTPYQGGAPFSSQFDIIAAQFSAAARAYRRCAASEPEVWGNMKEWIPDSPPEIGPELFITYAIRSVSLATTVVASCNALNFKITSDKTKCR